MKGKDLGKKVLNGAKYIVNNSWKILPIGASINVRKNKVLKELYKELENSVGKEITHKNIKEIENERIYLQKEIVKEIGLRNSIKQQLK
jgi:hypothetical protein